MNPNFLDFEHPIADLENQIAKLKLVDSGSSQLDISKEIILLEKKTKDLTYTIFKNLTSWQIAQLARHPLRPYTLDYIREIFTEYDELQGDRAYGDDSAIVGGIARLGAKPVMVVGQQKGRDTKEKIKRNFGMVHPEGYRRAKRLFELAEKFSLPVITFIDTPGAYPGLEAEERGQGEAIARNIFEMISLKVPVICVIIGEGASGGALGIGVGDKVVMMENTWYTVISPESCSSILWRSWDNKETAAEQLRLTGKDMLEFGLVDDVIPEPVGGAHWDYDQAAEMLKNYLIPTIQSLKLIPAEERVTRRIEKFGKMGFWEEVADTSEGNATLTQ